MTSRGNPWIRQPNPDTDAWIDSIGLEFGKLLITAGIDRAGVTFYTLRRTFRTVADRAGDQRAAAAIMGHVAADNDMGSIDVQEVGDDRLRAVGDHVRNCLFGTAATVTSQDTNPAHQRDPLALAIERARAAIAVATGPTRDTLESVWLPEIDSALKGESAALKRILRVWSAANKPVTAG